VEFIAKNNLMKIQNTDLLRSNLNTAESTLLYRENITKLMEQLMSINKYGLILFLLFLFAFSLSVYGQEEDSAKGKTPWGETFQQVF